MKKLLIVIFIVSLCLGTLGANPYFREDIELLHSLGTVRDIKIIGDHVFLLGSERMLMSFSLIDPEHPQMTGMHRIAATPSTNPLSFYEWKMFAMGDFLYVMTDKDYFSVLDVSNPSEIQWMGLADSHNIDPHKTVQDGTRLFVLHTGLLREYDFSDPLQPVVVEDMAINYNIAMARQGDYLFVIALDQVFTNLKLKVIDTTHPSGLHQINEIPINGDCLVVNEGYLYVNSFNDDVLDVYNVSNPLDISYQGTVNIYSENAYINRADGMRVAGDYLIVQKEANTTDGAVEYVSYVCLDISDASAPEVVAHILTGNTGRMNVFDAAGQYFVPTSFYTQAQVWTPVAGDWQQRSTIERGSVRKIASLGDYVCVNSGYALNINDLDAPPQFVKHFDYFLQDGDALYSTSDFSIFKWVIGDEGMPVMQAQNQIFPTDMWDFPRSYPVDRIGDYIYTGLFYLDTDLQDATQVVGSPLHAPRRIINVGNHVIVNRLYNGVDIFDATDPLQPILEVELLSDELVMGMTVHNNLLVTSIYPTGLNIYDISNINSPALVFSRPSLGPAWCLKTRGNNLLFAGDDYLVALSIANPFYPEEVGRIQRPGKEFLEFEIRDDKIFVCHGDHLGVYNLDELLTDTPDDVLPQPQLSVNCYPNPFAERITIQPEGIKQNRPYALSIYNIKGQKLLEHDGVKGDSHTWDGRNAEGRKLPSGIYLVRLQQGGQSIVKRMVLKH
ncbi:MAG: T9SS type A sorting domain-containing protein [Candidatus Cloacimonetes bacterium]|nr:T9SS type A sorting domain-containing protein [Candidatus Cloacimonadota bacterium]NLO11547.1 T9SS type A sorting domain-containing protein [Candidatus Cloacimonadota bacterium]